MPSQSRRSSGMAGGPIARPALPLPVREQTAQSLVGNLTVGGVAPVVLHFTNQKPWHGREPGRLGHQFLCSAADLRRRSVAAGMT